MRLVQWPAQALGQLAFLAILDTGRMGDAMAGRKNLEREML